MYINYKINQMEVKMKKFVSVLAVALVLTGCAGVYTRMSKSDLTIQTKMSSTIWLNPTMPEKTYIYVQSRNTSDNPAFNNLAVSIKKALMEKEYLITNNPDEANFILQTNVLKAVMVSDGINADQATSSSVLSGTGVGIAVGSKNNTATAVGAGLLTALASMYFDANTKDNYYAVQTDIRITERVKPYNADSISLSSQGNNTVTASQSNSVMNTKSYTTTLTVMANQVNLTVAEAVAPIKNAIANSLAGLF